jgi:division protein CdvB (Snf7/Vps24/ESCRT-III family)
MRAERDPEMEMSLPMTESLKLLRELRAQLTGLRAIADVIETTIIQIEGLEDSDEIGDVVNSELADTIGEIRNQR